MVLSDFVESFQRCAVAVAIYADNLSMVSLKVNQMLAPDNFIVAKDPIIVIDHVGFCLVLQVLSCIFEGVGANVRVSLGA